MSVRRDLALVVIVLSTVGCRDTEVLGPPIKSASTAAGAGGAAATAGASAGGATAAGGAGGAKAAAGATAAGGAGGAPAATVSDADYSKPENWLCRPGHNSACDVNIDSTVVKADGTLEVEKFQANAAAPIDCFYVYPTISNDTTDNSDLVAGPEEGNVVRSQLARFGSQCRLFAPMYRQVTLTSLRAGIAGTPTMPNRTLGYQDILKAWNYYLEHDNQGRGVVFVGHSQGSGVLTQLIKENLDQSPLDNRFISALLIGTNVLVPKDTLVGGTFKNVPICKSAGELGCIIVYASFRANTPPSATTSFARSTDANLVAACTNPAAVGGGSAELHSYLTASGMVLTSAPTPPWVTPEKPIDTPFVSTPGLITAECKFGMTGSYLAITVNGSPEDPRVDDIVGDVLTNGMVQADWGLHVIDMNLAMGNLVDVVRAKSEAFSKK
jgi:hypothetical protein